MKITGVDIRKQEFPRKFRGYDTLDVNAFLQFVADAVDRQHAKNEELEERCAELSRRVEETERREKLLEESLQAVNDMREEVKDRAENLLESARAESEKMRNQAEEDAPRAINAPTIHQRRRRTRSAMHIPIRIAIQTEGRYQIRSAKKVWMSTNAFAVGR